MCSQPGDGARAFAAPIASDAADTVAGDAETKEDYRRAAPTRGLKRSSGFETTKQSELRFRVLLTEGASEVELGLD